jgi:molybdate transport system substrate-binding protein
VQIAAASDLSVAFEELGQLFEARTGQKVTFSFAASGALAKQLSQGAPFDMFAAANAAFVDSAVKAGACDGASKARYGRGHVVAWSKRVKLPSLEDLRNPEIKRIAIANPEHAPYGKAAREALTKAGLWSELEPKIVQSENVRQALQFAQTGNAEVALVALSLVVSESSGQKLAIDPALYAPIEQTLVVCRRGKNVEGGRAFAQLVESSEGQALLERYGFGSTEQTGK